MITKTNSARYYKLGVNTKTCDRLRKTKYDVHNNIKTTWTDKQYASVHI